MREWAFMILLIVVFLVLPSIWALNYFSRTLGALGVLLALSGFVLAYRWRRSDVVGIVGEFKDSSRWFKGARGEYLVHKELASLPDEFIVFHDYHPRGSDGQAAKWNVDHIVVGPTGVFVLDAKNHSRAHVPSAAQDAHSKRSVEQVDRNAKELKRHLVEWSNKVLSDVFVVPVLVYAQDGATIAKGREDNVRVLPLRLLNREILRHTEESIDADRAARVARALFGELPAEQQILFKEAIVAYGRMAQGSQPASERVCQGQSGQAQASTVEVPDRCPLCGGALIQKTARRGSRVGRRFLSCENFRKTGCKYGFNLD